MPKIGDFQLKDRLKARINAMFWCSIIILGIVYLLSLLSLYRKDEASSWVGHTYQVKQQINRVVSDLNDAELNHRDYLLTHKSTSLQLYMDAMQSLPGHLETLHQFIGDNQTQGKSMSRLETLIRQKSALLNQSLSLQSTQVLAPTPQQIRLADQSQIFGRQIQSLVSAMNQEEERLLALRKSASYSASNQILIILCLSGLIVCCLLVGAFRLFNHLNQNLETMVNERTAELSESQQATADYAAKLEQSNRELEQFAAVASHDLKAPLRKITNFSQMLRSDAKNQLTPESSDYLTRIETSIVKMQALIDDLLALSRVTSRGSAFEAVNLSEVAHEVIQNLGEVISNVEGRVEIEPLPMVLGDETQLTQVFQNLIENGLKFHREGVPPVVRVTALPCEGADGCPIHVEDNGIGIEPEYQKRIFNIFERLHSQSIYPGTGVGLAIVKKIVERHQGTIQVDSAPNHGSRFIITLPMAQRIQQKVS